MSLALVVLGISMVLGCPPSNGNGDGNGNGNGNGGGDTTAPTLVSSIPRDGADDFPAGSNIILTYSEPVLVGTGEITLSYSDGTTINVTGLQVSIAGAVVTIDPTNPLDEPSVHALVIPAGAFMDAAGNTTAEDTIGFTTAAGDTTGPVFSLSVPANDATDVVAGTSIMLTYNEVVQAGTGDFLLRTSGQTIGGEITVTDMTAVTFDGTPIVTINPPIPLAVSTTYTLTVPASAITDASGNLGELVTISFVTAAAADNTAPTVLSSVPAQNGAAREGTNIVLTYSEPVRAVSGGNNITIIPEGSGDAPSIPVDDTMQVTIDGAVVTINPTNDLMPNVRYAVSIPAGAIQDLVGNNAGVFALSFDTTLMTIPSLESSVPSSGDDDFAITANIVLTYSEDVVAGSGSITITPTMPAGTAITFPVTDGQVTIAGAVVTINPTADLIEGTIYTLTVPANTFESSDDQTPAGASTLSFTTIADTTPPSVTSSVPASLGVIQASEDIVLTYSEPVAKGTGNISLKISGATTVTDIAVTSAQVSVAGNVVTINPTADLMPGNIYGLTVPAGSFVDLATPANATVNYTLDFSTAVALDEAAPTVSSRELSIAGEVVSVNVSGVTGVDLDSDIVLTYNETVQAGTGSITITPTGGTAITFSVTDGQVTIAGAVVTINPTADFEPNILHTVSISAGAITDNADSPNATAAVYTLSFTTRDDTRRVVLWVGGKGSGGLVSFLNDTTGCQGKPSVATGAVTRRFLATGNGNNQNPVNFTVDGTLLSGYSGATPVYAANSATTDLTDNDLVANSYLDLISPTTPLLRTFNQAGLNGGTDERSSTENFTFWTGLNNLTGSGYVVGPACIVGGNYWTSNSTFGGAGASNIVVKTPTDSSTFTANDVFGRQFGCENEFNVLCITY